jgi:Purple acid Phosphatase, N-terminal domain/Calcineurin-like phosphoesterase
MRTRCRSAFALVLALLMASGVSTLAQEPPEKKFSELTDDEKAQLAKEKQAAATAQKKLEATWKTIYRPTHVPDRVILTWNGDPATSQAVTWRTDTTATKGVGQIALSEGGTAHDSLGAKVRPNPDKTKTVPGKTEFVKSDLFEAHYHSVSFTELKPATKYVYRVGDGATWSEWYEFRTPSDKPEPLSFIYFGDAQNEVRSHWSRVVRGAYSDMPKAHFIIHAGDLINRGTADGEWGEWHHAAGWINGSIPNVPTPGNHEYSGFGFGGFGGGFPKFGSKDAPKSEPKNEPKAEEPKGDAKEPSKDGKKAAPKSRLSPLWKPQFTLHENGPAGLEETAYYFDIQGVRVISLNSNEKTEEQVPWMEKVLRDNPNKWTVITFHHPIYSTAKGRDNKKLRESWRPVFDKYTPDLVLTGHDHTYGRSGVMREDNLLTGARVHERGTVYVVSVSGPKFYKLEKEDWMQASAADTQLYQLIRIDGDTLHYEARTANGTIFDSFDLNKKPNGGPAPAAPDASGNAVPVWVALGAFALVALVVLCRRFVFRAAV